MSEQTLCNMLEQALLKQVFGSYPSGVAAICATVEGRPVGMAVSSFTSVSLEPPLVSVCMSNISNTWQLLRESPRLGLSVLSAKQGPLGRQLAGPSEARFGGVSVEERTGGALLISNAAAHLQCSLASVIPAGDHELIILRVHDAERVPDRPPLVFYSSSFYGLWDIS